VRKLTRPLATNYNSDVGLHEWKQSILQLLGVYGVPVALIVRFLYPSNCLEENAPVWGHGPIAPKIKFLFRVSVPISLLIF